MSVPVVAARRCYQRVTECAVCGDYTVRRPRMAVAMCWTCIGETADDITQTSWPPDAEALPSKHLAQEIAEVPVWRWTVVTNGGKS